MNHRQRELPEVASSAGGGVVCYARFARSSCQCGVDGTRAEARYAIAYWPQFDGLLDDLDGYNAEICDRITGLATFAGREV